MIFQNRKYILNESQFFQMGHEFSKEMYCREETYFLNGKVNKFSKEEIKLLWCYTNIFGYLLYKLSTQDFPIRKIINIRFFQKKKSLHLILTVGDFKNIFYFFLYFIKKFYNFVGIFITLYQPRNVCLNYQPRLMIYTYMIHTWLIHI